MMDTLRPMRRLLVSVLLLVVVACASTDRPPAGVARPLIEIQQLGDLFFGSERSTVVTIALEIENRATTPLTVRHVAISSFGMTDYALVPTSRTLTEIIPPGQSRTISLLARAEAITARSATMEPLSVRAVVRMEANGRGFREVVMQRLFGAAGG